MKRTMATVIVGPTIGLSVSVFAPGRGRCGSAAKANWRTIEKPADNGVRLEPCVNPETGMPLEPEARREGRS